MDVELDTDAARSRRRERPLTLWDAFFGTVGKTVHEDRCVRLVVAEGWAMQELEVHHEVSGQIEIEKFENINREERHEQMKRYFDDHMQIIPAAKDSPRIPDLPWIRPALRSATVSVFAIVAAIVALVAYVSFRLASPPLIILAISAAAGAVLMFSFLTWLINRYRKDGVWPGLMEERLSDSIRRKFPDADSQVRHVIDRYSDVFLDNNWMLVRLKRFFQASAIALFLVLVVPLGLLSQQFMVSRDWVSATLALCAVPAVILLISALFQFFNHHVYTKLYSQSLRVSAQRVENLILERMTSINILLQHTINHITQLMQQGERPARDPSKLDDLDLREYDTFFAMQTLFWLAKRLEYIELHLHNSLHTLLTVEGVMDIAGRVRTLAIAIIGATPALIVAFELVLTTAPTEWPSVIGPLVCVVLTLLFVAWVSHTSFANEKWNPIKLKSQTNLLEEHFELKFRAQTYEKQKLDVKLAARAQRAMFAIHAYFEKMGMGGGRPHSPSV